MQRNKGNTKENRRSTGEKHAKTPAETVGNS